MLRPRLIPVLLLQENGLVKTFNFDNPKYIGDPLNAVRIFNEKQVDELMILDIDSSIKGLNPNYSLISKIANECRMPLSYGGGIKDLESAEKIISFGVEKISISSSALTQPSLIKEISSTIGSQSVSVVLDVRKNLFKKYKVYSNRGKKRHKGDLKELIRKFVDLGAGEIIINSIDKDGSLLGYDLDLAHLCKEVTKTPITFIGGLGHIDHVKELVNICGIVGCAGGSFFVFKGKHRAVLITYPTFEEKLQSFSLKLNE